MLYDLSEKQALTGICFCGVQKLHDKYNYQLANLTKPMLLQWVGMATNYQARNEELNKQCVTIQKQFKEAGLNTCILKGQGVASYYYPELSLFRQSGDIDIWVDASWKEVMDYVNSRTPNREFDMKHTHLEIFSDTIVEVHWWPSMPTNPCYRKALQSYYRKQSPIQCNHQVRLHDGTIITAPDAKFEAVHILYHIFNHFLYEGIGLRQMLDLYFVLVNGDLTEEDKKEVLETYKKVGLFKIAKAVMWVFCEVFKMDEKYCIGNKEQSLGRTLLNEIEEGGNFGVYSDENHVYKESFFHRMKRRYMRRIRLAHFNPVGVMTTPLTKIKIMLWKRKVIKMYNL